MVLVKFVSYKLHSLAKFEVHSQESIVERHKLINHLKMAVETTEREYNALTYTSYLTL